MDQKREMAVWCSERRGLESERTAALSAGRKALVLQRLVCKRGEDGSWGGVGLAFGSTAGHWDGEQGVKPLGCWQRHRRVGVGSALRS